MFQAIDKTIIDNFRGELKNILELELELGNAISETFKGDWQYVNILGIILEKQFLSPIKRNLEDIELKNINDPHSWKAEYFDNINRLLLACKFEGVPNFNVL